MTRFAVLVSGRGSNLRALAEAAKSKRIPGEIALVVSNRPGAKALEFATDAGLPTAVLPHKAYSKRRAYDRDLVRLLQAYDIDWVLLAGFMRILSEVVVEAYPQRILNIHPSLLPAFPGLAPQQQAIDAGVAVSGCSVHFVDAGMDTGIIAAQAVVPVKHGDDAAALSKRILKAEHKLYPRVMRWAAEGLLDDGIPPDTAARLLLP
ncbi:MAG: phosphoribosylglycinamide formyltransferase [Proteobacteria bacterium]|nr:phosphoribosylglycinamide formyltransferase [Pseudomonadota bacterium]